MLAIGAAGEKSAATGIGGDDGDGSAKNAGATYVFCREGGQWSQKYYVKASNTDAFDNFAADVALTKSALIVGAFAEGSAAVGINGNQGDNGAALSGAAYLFSAVQQ